jgi:hypothetical protein
MCQLELAFKELLQFGSSEEPIVDRFPNLLLATKVSFSCLYRRVSKQELDLFLIPAVAPAELCTGPTKIMRCELPDSGTPSVM